MCCKSKDLNHKRMNNMNVKAQKINIINMTIPFIIMTYNFARDKAKARTTCQRITRNKL